MIFACAMSESSAIAALNKLDSKERKMVNGLVRGISIQDSGRVAGYTFDVAANVARSPKIIAAVELELARILRLTGAPIALATLIRLAKNGVSETVQVTASKILLDRAGFVPPVAKQAQSSDEKQLVEMGQDELRAVMESAEREIREIEGELAARAAPLDAPNAQGKASKPSKFLD